MRKLSTSFTFFNRLFAIVWVAYFSLSIVYGVWQWLSAPKNAAPFSLGKLVLFAIFGLFSSAFVHYMWGSLKVVYLKGRMLVVSNLLKKIEVPLSNVEYVSKPDWTSSRRITITLREPSEFGDEIIFAPGFFQADEVAELLRNLVGVVRDRPEDYPTGRALAVYLKRYGKILKQKKG